MKLPPFKITSLNFSDTCIQNSSWDNLSCSYHEAQGYPPDLKRFSVCHWSSGSLPGWHAGRRRYAEPSACEHELSQCKTILKREEKAGFNYLLKECSNMATNAGQTEVGSMNFCLPHRQLPFWPMFQLAPEWSHALLYFHLSKNREANQLIFYPQNSELPAAHTVTQNVLQGFKSWNWDEPLETKFRSRCYQSFCITCFPIV